MASSWLNSWGSSWGNSWGATTTDTQVIGGGVGYPSKEEKAKKKLRNLIHFEKQQEWASLSEKPDKIEEITIEPMVPKKIKKVYLEEDFSEIEYLRHELERIKEEFELKSKAEGLAREESKRIYDEFIEAEDAILVMLMNHQYELEAILGA